MEGVIGERGGGGTGDTEEEVPRVNKEAEGPSESPASGGEGEPESESRTQIPESKLLLDWLLLVLLPPGADIPEMSGSRL